MLFEKYYENPETIHVNDCEPRAYYVPTSPQNKEFTYMENSERVKMLSGDNWSFHLYPSPYDVENFFDLDYKSPYAYDTITVPSCWNMIGYDRNEYSCFRYTFPFDPPYVPDENPSGAYVKYFNMTADELKMKNYLNFEGVSSCKYVWINGKFVGYGQVSRSTSEFDISDYLVEGENKLAVLVLKYCTGSYFEAQDQLKMYGIFRDVYIISRPKNHIRDYYVKTDLDSSYKNATVSIDASWSGEVENCNICLFDPFGKKVLEDDFSEKIFFEIENAYLWNAEEPLQYTAVFSTKDETIVQKIGVHKYEIKNASLYVNDVIIKIKGINRHDADAKTGYTISREQFLKDLEMMKTHNFNGIRTSHYPNAPWLTQYCSEYGMYIMDECDYEANGTMGLYDTNWNFISANTCEFVTNDNYCILSNDPVYEKTTIDRVQRGVMRDKNCACVLIWSLGNEAGFGVNLEKAAAWIKSFDKDFITHYDAVYCQATGHKNDLSNIDVHLLNYPTKEKMEDYFDNHLQKTGRPMVVSEFLHSKGNSPGNVEDYFENFYQYDGLAGGFLWEWCDHSVLMGRTNDGKEIYYYGGDWGDDPTSGGENCLDGIIPPDRTVSTGLLEWKQGARPVRAEVLDIENKIFRINNKYDFLNLRDTVYIEYEISRNAEVCETGVIDDLDVSPHSFRDIKIPFTMPKDGKVFLRIIYKSKKETAFISKDFEYGFDEFLLKNTNKISFNSPKSDGISIKENDKFIFISGQNFKYTYNKLKANFDKIVKDNVSIIDKPMEYNIWRAPTGSDTNASAKWHRAGYDKPIIKAYKTEIIDGDGFVTIKTELSVLANYRERLLEILAFWNIYSDGRINIHFDVKRKDYLPFLPRFGLRLFMPKSFSSIDYFGYGPYESYVDKHHSSHYGRFKTKVSETHIDYIVPQENGSRWGCDSLAVSNEDDFALKVFAENFSFNASEYTQEMLTESRHNFEIEKSDYTVLCIDGKMSGIGSSSCGPKEIDPKYQVNQTEFSIDIDIIME
ncbi:MAG: glycoside hydrolase family 2 TIM barrel-domain containing protein [Clostridia bacterium]